jgi:hypothetical protein
MLDRAGRGKEKKESRGVCMIVYVVGSGKLAAEIISSLKSPNIGRVIPWAEMSLHEDCDLVVVHAGSGRELESVYNFCTEHEKPLIELATNTLISKDHHAFPLVVCPNVNILLLKFMAMIAKSGNSFLEYERTIVESHQSTKTSAPGTAYVIAKSLGVEKDKVESVRDPLVQEKVLGIPGTFLSRHAYHKITITDSAARITLEAKVLGPEAYSAGLAKIIDVIKAERLEKRIYHILEFVEKGWI